MLAELCKDAHCALGVQEGNVQLLGTFARGFVDETYAGFFGFFQGIGYAVFHTEGHVVHALTFLFDEFGNGAFGRCGFQQFEFHLTAFEECSLYFLVCHFFYVVSLQSQYVFKVWKSLFDAFNGYSDVFNV